jgi:hypothetical protein
VSPWEDGTIGTAPALCLPDMSIALALLLRNLGPIAGRRLVGGLPQWPGEVRQTCGAPLFVILRADGPMNLLPSPTQSRSFASLRMTRVAWRRMTTSAFQVRFSFLGAASDLAQLGLLLARQQILDAHQQGQVRFLDLLLESEDPIGLREHAALVDRTFVQ